MKPYISSSFMLGIAIAIGDGLVFGVREEKRACASWQQWRSAFLPLAGPFLLVSQAPFRHSHRLLQAIGYTLSCQPAIEKDDRAPRQHPAT